MLEDGFDTDERALQSHLASELEQPDRWLIDESSVVKPIPKAVTGRFDKKDYAIRSTWC